MAFNLSDVIQLADAQVQYQEYRAMFNAGSGDIPEGQGRQRAHGRAWQPRLWRGPHHAESAAAAPVAKHADTAKTLLIQELPALYG